jgi:hypothetical protein
MAMGRQILSNRGSLSMKKKVYFVAFLIQILISVYLFRFYQAMDNAIQGARLLVDELMPYERYVALALSGVVFLKSVHTLSSILKGMVR